MPIYTSLNEINAHYSSLGVKSYWNEESLNFEIINQITTMFDTLHVLYPFVQIKEIGDIYSYDKEKHENIVNYIEKNINNKTFYNDFKTEDSKKKFNENLDKLVKRNITINENGFGKEYADLGYLAKYYINEMRIEFNHKINQSYAENLIHEFGHAIAFQYDLKNDEIIKEIYNNTPNEEIEKHISPYANKDIDEFIAESFNFAFIDEKNDLARKVKNRIDEINIKKILGKQ